MDLHKKPFDDATQCKLEIFESYTEAWLPTFIMQDSGTICIFDLFAGPGYDKNGTAGSPIRLLRQVVKQSGYIFQRNVRVCIWLNEYMTEKYKLLVRACDTFIEEHEELSRLKKGQKLSVKITNCGIPEVFPQIIGHIQKYPSLVFLDQNGVKWCGDEYMTPLIKSSRTDVLVYFASSYVKRFASRDEFKRNISFDLSGIQNVKLHDVHRWVVQQLQKRIPQNCDFRLRPFTIKKEKNIYGIIFGASHIRAVDKFLNLAWSLNHINGEANFDIDADEEKTQLCMFEEKKLTKLEQFQHDLRDAVLSKNVRNNKEAYDFAIDHGHISNHADEVIRALKKEKKITFDDRSPKCNYNQVYKNKIVVEYHIL